MVLVLTIDQRASRRGSDLVPPLLDDLNRRRRRDGLLRRFERTAGDEVQGILSDASAAIEVVLGLLRHGEWNIGIGVGPVDEPLPRSTRAARGAAFRYARDAVDRAKSAPHHVCVVGADAYRAERLETVLWLVAVVIERRTPRGWEVADLVADGLGQREIGEQLGISQSAVSQRAQAAGLTEEQRGRALAVELLEEAAEEVQQ